MCPGVRGSPNDYPFPVCFLICDPLAQAEVFAGLPEHFQPIGLCLCQVGLLLNLPQIVPQSSGIRVPAHMDALGFKQQLQLSDHLCRRCGLEMYSQIHTQPADFLERATAKLPWLCLTSVQCIPPGMQECCCGMPPVLCLHNAPTSSPLLFHCSLHFRLEPQPF